MRDGVGYIVTARGTDQSRAPVDAKANLRAGYKAILDRPGQCQLLLGVRTVADSQHSGHGLERRCSCLGAVLVLTARRTTGLSPSVARVNRANVEF